MGDSGGPQLCCFEPISASAYASVSSDNRIKVWDTASGNLRQQYVEPRHLSKKYTCIAWHRSAKARRDTARNTKLIDLGLLALGTTKGSVTVWNLRRGAVLRSLGEGEGLPEVTSVAFSLDGSSLYASSGAKEVIEWSLETGAETRRLRGNKHGSSQVQLHPGGLSMAVASSVIKVIDLSTGKRQRKLSPGHSGTVRTLRFSVDGRYLASNNAGSRFVNLFDVGSSSGVEGPVVTLSLPAPPLFLDLHASGGMGAGGGGEVVLTLMAGMDSGEVEVIRARHTIGETDPSAVPPVSKCRLRGSSSSSHPNPIPGSQNVVANQGYLSLDRPGVMILALGSAGSKAPEFREIAFQDHTGALLPSASAVADGDSERNNATSTNGDSSRAPTLTLKDSQAQVHVVGPGEMGIPGVERDLAGDVGVRRAVKKRRREGEEEEGANETLHQEDHREEGEEEQDFHGMTIAERLEALSEAFDKVEEVADSCRGEGEGDLAMLGAAAQEGGRAVGGELSVVPRAESLSTVLSQALQSGDENLLEQVLGTGDQGVIEATVERLPSSKVVPFLLRVVAKFEKRPHRAGSLGRWIRAVLSSHMGFLVSIPSLADKLALLHQLVDRRVAFFPNLLQLNGRLDLLLAKAKAAGEVGLGRGGRAEEVFEAEAVYKEGEEDSEGEESYVESEEPEDTEGDEEDHGEGSGIANGVQGMEEEDGEEEDSSDEDNEDEGQEEG
ncbi:unnamed protein product [Discosporangium mesarthrocarpum]